MSVAATLNSVGWMVKECVHLADLAIYEGGYAHPEGQCMTDIRHARNKLAAMLADIEKIEQKLKEQRAA